MTDTTTTVDTYLAAWNEEDAAAAFIAAFLNAVFGLCLGCQLYLLLQRAGIVGRARPASA